MNSRRMIMNQIQITRKMQMCQKIQICKNSSSSLFGHFFDLFRKKNDK